MKIPKGILLRKKPYVISAEGKEGMKIHLNSLSDLRLGDRVYQEKLDNGIILLIPENLYNGGEEFKKS